MNIITIFGVGNSGKTTLIKNVFNQLKDSDGEIFYYKVQGKDRNDFHAILVWRGKIIAICSIGDCADDEEKNSNDTLWKLNYIKSGIVLAKEYEADILINAFSLDNSNNLTKENYDKLLSRELVTCSKEFELNMQESNIQYAKQRQQFLKIIIYELNKII